MLNRVSSFITSLFLFIVSLILYLFAPDVYSNQYCIILFMVFLIVSFITIRQTTINNNYFTFHVLFLISFFFVNFVYPVFLYPQNPLYYSVFKFEFNHQVISRATALALLGVCSYNLGVVLYFRNDNVVIHTKKPNYSTLLFLLNIWVYFIFIILLIFAGKEMVKGNFGATSQIPAGLLVIFQVSIGISVILNIVSQNFKESIFNFLWRFNKPTLLILLCFGLLFLYTGDRGPVLQVILITIGAFSLFIKSINLRHFILIVLFGMFVLTFVSYARSKTVTVKKQGGIANYFERGSRNIKMESVFDLGMDLTINNRNLYVGVEYVQENGFNYGKSMFYYFFAPVPFLPSLMTNIFMNSEPSELTSAYIITKRANATYGLGTNIIADLYMAFGMVGVIVFMFLLGYLVTNFQLKAYFSEDMYYIITYIFLISFSVYLPRTSIFSPFRHIIWAIVILMFFKSLRLMLIKLSKNTEG